MTRRTWTIALLWLVIGVGAAAQRGVTDDRNSVVASGGRFAGERLSFAPADCSLYWVADNAHGGAAKASHLRMLSRRGPATIELQLNFPSQAVGSFDLVPGDGDVYNLTHWAMLSVSDTSNPAGNVDAKLRKLTVTISRYDAPGGVVEGRFTGTLFTTTNAPYREVDMHVDGQFAVTRGPDDRR